MDTRTVRVAEEPPTSITIPLPDRSARLPVIPTPKEMVSPTDAAPFRLTPQTRLMAGDDRPGTRRALAVLTKAIADRCGFTLKPIPPGVALDGRGNVLRVQTGGATPPAFSAPEATHKPEGYTVAVGKDHAIVVGEDDAGTLWGAQTLVQLMAKDGDVPVVRAATVRDWPTLAVRGVHLFHGKNALAFHTKLIERIVSPFKLNTLVIQAEQLRWDADPTIAPAWAGSKADVRTEIARASEYGIRVYPLVESYGHLEWFFAQKDHLRYAEDPDKPFALNFTDPQAVGSLERIVGEADDLFGAPAFHIGLDEVIGKVEERGRFPYRSKGHTFPDLFVMAATHWHDFLKARGKETWMWADMAMHESEVVPSYGSAPSVAAARQIREALPKDIVMLDWQYSARPSYPSLKTLKDAGFTKIIGATWYMPDGIQNFSKAAADAGILGCLQTTWCGYESSESVLDTAERRQFVAMVAAAEYFWNGGSGPTPDKLPYDPAEVFKRQYGK